MGIINGTITLESILTEMNTVTRRRATLVLKPVEFNLCYGKCNENRIIKSVYICICIGDNLEGKKAVRSSNE